MSESHETYDPELYALLHRGTDGDLGYYVDAVDGAESVLEIGCGYGRILKVLSDTYPDLRLCGIDIHEGLLSMARASLPSRVSLHHANMTNFQLAERFDVVIAAYSTLWCLARDEETRSCLGRVFNHLNEGGRFLFDAYGADKFHEDMDIGYVEEDAEEQNSVAEIYTDRCSYHVVETSIWYPKLQSFEVFYDYQPIAPHEHLPQIVAGLHHRYQLAGQLIDMLRGGGFSECLLWDGFERRSWTPEASHLVGEARVGVSTTENT